MKKLLLKACLPLGLILTFASCDQDEAITGEEIPADVLQNIERLGFSTDGVFREKELGGYIIEGDIHITEEELKSVPQEIRVPNEEQYRTFNVVKMTPRTIRISVDSKVSSIESNVATAIERYNNENLLITFTMLESGRGDIHFTLAPRNAGYLASAGFPTRKGDPHRSIKVNLNAMRSYSEGAKASIMAHEIGHCIGFRHTDWYDRSISCGGGGSEGQETSGVGAEHIPGTPSKDDNVDGGSFMLSCIGSNTDRDFTNFDKIALDYLY